MKKFFVAGFLWIFITIAIAVGVAVVDSIMGYNTFARLGNARAAILLSASIMFGSIILLIGGILQQMDLKSVFAGHHAGKEELKEQIRYYQQVLENTEQFNEQEKENLIKIIAELNEAVQLKS